ncbi:MAG: hypothetical protein GXY25_22090, partial [Pirellulaceae bacterium]|nr:hypothetical protein [Pirellulaceae bacterium]
MSEARTAGVGNGARIAGLAGVAVLLAARLAAAAETPPPAASESKFAWPRADQVVLDGVWDLAWSDPAETPDALPEVDKLDWFQAAVPCEVHWALHRAGKAPNPYVGL